MKVFLLPVLGWYPGQRWFVHSWIVAMVSWVPRPKWGTSPSMVILPMVQPGAVVPHSGQWATKLLMLLLSSMEQGRLMNCMGYCAFRGCRSVAIWPVLASRVVRAGSLGCDKWQLGLSSVPYWLALHRSVVMASSGSGSAVWSSGLVMDCSDPCGLGLSVCCGPSRWALSRWELVRLVFDPLPFLPSPFTDSNPPPKLAIPRAPVPYPPRLMRHVCRV